MASDSDGTSTRAQHAAVDLAAHHAPATSTEVELIRPHIDAVPAAAREGVFVHSFMCNECGLHFNVYSWQARRQRAENVYCPECGQHAGRFRHWRGQLSELSAEELRTRKGRQAMLNSPGEIYRHCPAPGVGFMPDSSWEGLRQVSHL